MFAAVILLGALGAPGALGALGASGALGALGVSRPSLQDLARADAVQGPSAPSRENAKAWQGDVGVIALSEAWDFNDAAEALGGVVAGLDRTVWRRVAVRGEVMAMRVWQDSADAWLRGFTVGTRVRWSDRAIRPLVDVAVGLSHATRPVPAGGTRFNYLAVIGAGIERPVGATMVGVTGRWVHASNNGREGSHLNPDIQSLGVLVSVGWEH